MSFAHELNGFLGESAGMGLAAGQRWEQQVNVCLLLCVALSGSLKYDAAFVQLRDANILQLSADLELNFTFLGKCISFHLLYHPLPSPSLHASSQTTTLVLG